MNGNFLSIAIISMNEHKKYYNNRSSNFNQWKTKMSVSFYHVMNRTKNMTNKLLYFQYIHNAIFHQVTKTITLIIAKTFVDFQSVSVDINISNIWAKIILKINYDVFQRKLLTSIQYHKLIQNVQIVLYYTTL